MIQEFAKLRNISIEDAEYMSKRGNHSIFCKCGKYRKVQKSSQSKIGMMLALTCGDRECHAGFGKKRPNHAILMKSLAVSGSEEYKSTLMKSGKLHNKNINTIEFKRTALAGKMIDVAGKSDKEIEDLYSAMLSERMTSVSRRRLEIVARYNRWEPEYKELIERVTFGIPTSEYVNSLTDEEVQRVWARVHGISTIRNGIKVCRPGWFKRILKTDFKYNFNQQARVITRSGLESDYIDYFEKNEIPWAYEPYVIETMDKSGFHVPDFHIKMNEEDILLEVKGGFFNQEKEHYIKNKVAAAMNYAKSNGMRYILTHKTPEKFMTSAMINIKEQQC